LAKDYRTAELVVKSKPLTEATVSEFAKAKKLEEIIVSISRLSGLSATEIERLFMGSWSSPVAVIFKAIGFRLATVDAIYRSRLSSDGVIHNDLSQVKAEFIALRRPTAERIMRFYCARKAAKLFRPRISDLTCAKIDAGLCLLGSRADSKIIFSNVSHFTSGSRPRS
jgi:hypothetical protein